MKDFFLSVIAVIVLILLFFSKEILELILEAVLGFCPPILIFIIAAACIYDGGCLANIGGGCLVIVGIIAFIAWLIWRFG